MQSTLTIPKVQSAWKVVGRGHPTKAVVFDKNDPVPSDLKPGEVLVKVQAAAFNPMGYKLMKMIPTIISRRPFTAENDLAGIVVLSASSEFKPGDRVFGYLHNDIQRRIRQGALNQYTRLPASSIAPLPSNISFTQGSGFALAGVTALQALVDCGNVQEGQSVFINGGSSSVGAFAIQIAKAKGCKVVASASGGNEELVRGLGADDFVDYTKTSLHTYFTENPPSPKFHIILDAAGLIDPSLYTHSTAYLAPDGVFISSLPMPTTDWRGFKDSIRTVMECFLRPRWLGGTPRKYTVVTIADVKEDLNTLQDFIERGKVKPVVDSVFAFEDVLKAFERVMSKRARGKVVVKVDPETE